MADPFTIVSVVSTAFSAIGALASANAKSNQATAQAQAADYNAAVDKNNATNALQVSAENASERQRQNSLHLASQRAAIAQSGTGMDGSNLDVLGQSAQNLELDALNVRYGGLLNAKGYNDRSALGSQQASAYRTAADDATSAGYIGAAASVLGGTGNYLKNKP